MDKLQEVHDLLGDAIKKLDALKCGCSVKPTTKKIDHSMLVGSDVLCQFKDGEYVVWPKMYSKLVKVWHDSYPFESEEHVYAMMRVAFDIPQVHTGDTCPVPEGYVGFILFEQGLWSIEAGDLNSYNWGMPDCKIVAYKVTGIAEGWEL